MIRRIVESLRTGSFSVFATELIIVIVGVFIGLQVANWNDDRKDEFRAQSYLERIRNDLNTDIVNYTARLKFWEEVSRYGLIALEYAHTGNPDELSEWEVLHAFFQSSQTGQFNITRNTFDELKSSGELGLIRDLELRNMLSSYYNGSDNPVLSEVPIYREHVRGLIPLHIQSYIWENCYAIDQESQIISACESPIDPEDAAEILGRISKNTQLITELRYWMSTMQVSIIIGNDRTMRAEQVLELVNERIGDDS